MNGPSLSSVLYPDRLFPAEPTVRTLARDLYEEVAGLGLLSPHGHVDAALLAEDRPFAGPVELLVRPDHYVLRLLHARGVSWPELGIAPLGAPGPGPAGTAREEQAAGMPAVEVAGSRQVWRQLCRHWPAFRGTVMRLWMEHTLADLFGVDQPLEEQSADHTYETVAAALTRPDMLPRALYRRFRLEVLATTDSPLDSLAAHRSLRESPGWAGRVVPTFRPDTLTDPGSSSRWAQLVDQLGEVSGIGTGSYTGYIAALEARRQDFKALGATAADHGHFSAEALELSGWEAARLYDRLRRGPYEPSDAAVFSGHMLMEMARMSAEDGLVMQLHPGVLRGHDAEALARFGPDLGADFPVPYAFTASLQRMLSRFGNSAGFRAVAFTTDETAYSRELAPMASYYPGLWLGAPWWFLDAPDAMGRFWSACSETAGFSKSAGFVDDTRAYCSVPARHDLARRAHCAFLARLVAEHRVSRADASELAADFAYNLPKEAFRLG